VVRGVMARPLAFSSLILLVFLLVGCDHATKLAAETRLADKAPMALVPGVLELRYTENEDTAFSLTRSFHSPYKAPLLAAFALAGTVGIALFARKRFPNAATFEKVALALVLAGAAANVIDRLRRGFVVDFIHLQHWPFFNLADVWVVLGGVLLALRLQGRGPPEGDTVPQPPALP
jgi:signal peptidase II